MSRTDRAIAAQATAMTDAVLAALERTDDPADHASSREIIAHLARRGTPLAGDAWRQMRTLNLILFRAMFRRLPSSRLVQMSGDKYNRSWVGVRLR